MQQMPFPWLSEQRRSGTISQPRFKQEGRGCTWELPKPLNFEGRMGKNGQKIVEGKAGPSRKRWRALSHCQRMAGAIIDLPGKHRPAVRDLLPRDAPLKGISVSV